MNKILTLCAFLSLSHSSIAQTFDWAVSYGGTSTSFGYAICADDSGYVYTTGFFQGTADFDPGPGVLNFTATSEDAFICKNDSAGNLVWAKQLSANKANSISVDKKGNVVVAGLFEGTEDFDPGNSNFLMTADRFDDVFVCKLDRNGNFMWARKIGGEDNTYEPTLCLDFAGNIYVTGVLEDTLSIGQFSLIPEGARDVFIAKLDSMGNPEWVNKIGGLATQHSHFIACDSAGNSYVTGTFQDSTYFSPSQGVAAITPAGSDPYDIFIGKIDPQGVPVWLKRFGGDNSAICRAMTISDSNYIYLTGYFSGTADLAPGMGVANYTAVSTMEVFISKLDTSGNLVWTRQLQGNTVQEAFGISTDKYDNVYTAGTFRGTVDLDPGPGVFSKTSNGTHGDVFIHKLSSSGNFDWGGTFGSNQLDLAYAITSDPKGNFYTTGHFSGNIDVDPDTGSSYITSLSLWNTFVHKMSACLESVYIKDTSCNSFTTPSGKHTWFQSGIYSEYISTPAGCDSLIHFEITLLSDTSFLSATSCKPFVSPSQNYIWNQSGTYYDTIYQRGCEKIVKVNLTVDTIKSLVDNRSPLLVALDSTASYQWIFCDSISIPGATKQSFLATENGKYAVILSKHNCIDTSACTQVSNIGLSESGLFSQPEVYPNPITNTVNISAGKNLQGIQIDVKEIGGKLVSRHLFLEGENLSFQLSAKPGVYFVELTAKNYFGITKVIKQ